MKPNLTEINIVPIKPTNGLVGFASFVLDGNLYLGSVGIMTRPGGGYRLTYPTKKVGATDLNVFFPINKDFAHAVEETIIQYFEKVMKPSNDRHHSHYS